MPRASSLPQLPIFEGLRKWGDIRLNTKHLENVTTVELRRYSTEEWKPLFVIAVIDNKPVFRVIAENNERVLVYDAITGTFSNLASKGQLRDGDHLRNGEAGQDDNGGEKPSS